MHKCTVRTCTYIRTYVHMYGVHNHLKMKKRSKDELSICEKTLKQGSVAYCTRLDWHRDGHEWARWVSTHVCAYVSTPTYVCTRYTH